MAASRRSKPDPVAINSPGSKLKLSLGKLDLARPHRAARGIHRRGNHPSHPHQCGRVDLIR
jgi:hypothetical protein